MTGPQKTAPAKQRVLDWVRSKNPQTMELKFGCRVKNNIANKESIFILYCRNGMVKTSSGWRIPVAQINHHYTILGSDMGLQELLVAFGKENKSVSVASNGGFTFYEDKIMYPQFPAFDLSKNLHNQEDKFFQSLLPLLPTIK